LENKRAFRLARLGISYLLVFSSFFLFQTSLLYAEPQNKQVNVWLTDLSTNTLLAPQDSLTLAPDHNLNPLTIHVDNEKRYQQMVGFGADFTDSSAWLVYNKLNTEQRNTLMNRLFSPASGIGLNFLRQPMGASDFSTSGNYSYDDMPSGQTDPNLDHFSIQHDTAYIIPLLKQASQLNTNLKIMASPWSAPGWMKSSGSMIGGKLNANAFEPFANYFVKYIQAYQAQGIPIDYVTPQNEPLFTPSGYPGMSFPAIEESNFIKNNLGPAFTKNDIHTKILAYDHNWDQLGYPETILSDSSAANYISGIAWHCYGGTIGAQSEAHNAYPNKDAFMTECSGGTWVGSDQNALQGTLGNLVINGSRNWAKGVLLWNMALDPANGPTNGGCNTCRGVVTVDPATGNVTYNMDYYALGHASKFVKPGAYRIASNTFGSGSIEDVAFENPDGTKVLITINSGTSANTFKVDLGNKSFNYTLTAGAAATFTWSEDSHGNPHFPASGTIHDVEFTNPDHSKVMITYDENELNHASIMRDGNNLIKYLLPAGGSLSGNGTETALPRTGWIASASSTDTYGDKPGNTVDGNSGTRWSSGQGQANGAWFQQDMGTPQTFNQIVMDSGSSIGDYAHGYQVYVSNDGMDWGSAIASGLGSGQEITVIFPTQTARYVRVVQTGDAGNWWSIHEFNVYQLAPQTINSEVQSKSTTDEGSKRDEGDQLKRADFTNSDGSKVQIVYNSGNTSATFVQTIGDQEPYTATLPAGAAATFTSYNIIKNLPVPNLDNLSSSSGFARSGIILTGTNFGSLQGISTVKFGSAIASVIQWSNTSINVLVPKELPAGTVTVAVYADGQVSNTKTFTVTTPTNALPRTGWTAAASSTSQWDKVSNMLDNNLNTRWSSGQGQSPGQWVQFDMGTQRTLNQIVMDSGSGTGDYARAYQVYVSNDGTNWGNPIVSHVGVGPVEAVSFSSQTTRYIKIVNTGNTGNWWSIAEFYGMNN
jgi:O-glycosyl hydrolase